MSENEKDKFTPPEPIETTYRGVKWKKFCCSFKSPEGKFSFEIYAVNREHADIMLEDLKHTATVDGEMVSTREKEDDPEND